MTIGSTDGHFVYVPILRHSLSGPAVPLLFFPSLTVLCCSVLPLLFRAVLSFPYCSVLFCSVPSFPTRSRIPPVILSERSESKDLLKDTRPATTRETE